jgi:hypothetical protein
MTRRSIPGIFCIEGAWSAPLTSIESVKPLLESLRPPTGSGTSISGLETATTCWN